MYMLRAYQSPYSIADCGPQCAQMPNLASRYHSGTSHWRRDSRVPLNGPGAIGRSGVTISSRRDRAKLFCDKRSAGAPAIIATALLRLIFIDCYPLDTTTLLSWNAELTPSPIFSQFSS